MAIFPGSAIPSAAEDYTIDNSLRFDSPSDSRLERQEVGEPTSKKTFTLSCWLKLNERNPTDEGMMILSGELSGTGAYLWIADADQINSATGATEYFNTTAVFRDYSAWYHLVVVWDSTDSTPADRNRLYVNGTRITDFTTSANPDLDFEFQYLKSNAELKIGHWSANSSNYYNGYMAEYHVIDGQALEPDNFGELDSTTNQWIPKEYTGTYGNNGFYQKYSSTELANSFADSTGPWTATSFTTVETTSWTAPAGITEVEYLVVAGGGSGGGGYAPCGGGGAGGYRTGTYTVVPGNSYAVTVGAGGASTSSAGQGNDGSNSTFGTGTVITSVGGGGGGGNGSANGRVGGSGGGSWRTGSGGSGTTDEGNDGGDGCSSPSWAAGGGGGAGGAGGNGDCSAPTGGAGGAGTASSITGSSVTRAGGGGGAVDDNTSGTAGPGGSGGGGTGARKGTSAATAGTANTGSGGGGGYSNDPSGGDQAASGAGGTGIVIIRYFDASGTITNTQSPLGRHTITANGDVANTRAVRKVGDSSIKFDGTGDYLSVPSSSDWAFGTGDFTVEYWSRYDSLYDYITTFSVDRSSTTFNIGTQVNGNPVLYIHGQGTILDGPTSTYVTDTWYHTAFVRQSGTMRVYVGGVQKDSATNTTDLSAGLVTIGALHDSGGGGGSGASEYMTGYLDEFRISDTCRYDDGTTFTPQTTEFTADANTKLLIHSNWTGGLGADSSGNYNTFTPTNLVATDSLIDSPTNNWATMSPIDTLGNSAISLSEGNLKCSSDTDDEIRGTIAIPATGKWYWEYLKQDAVSAMIGVVDQASQVKAYGSNRSVVFSSGSGTVYNFAAVASYGASWTDGDLMAVAINRDDNEITLYKNNVAQPTLTIAGTADQRSRLIPATVTGTSTIVGTFNFGQDSSFAGAKTAQGNQDANELGDFYYAPPTDYLALCSDNLSDPEIALPGENFNTIIYDDGAGAKTGVGFQPDLVWVKSRGSTYDHKLTDAVRGVTKSLESNTAIAEATDSTGLTAFGADGFTVGADTNYSDTTGTGMVAWNWKAGGAPTADNSAGAGATPTAGSVKIDGANLGSALAGTLAATRLSANTTAGFSMVKYVGTGATATIAHGLGVAPELVIVKSLDSAEAWNVYAEPVSADPGTDYLTLNSTAAVADDDRFWNDTVPSASVFTVGSYDGTNKSTDDLVAYCFTSIEGYSKVGSYVTNTSSASTNNGNFLYTGFKPAWFLNKMTSGPDGTGGWFLYDNKRNAYNLTENYLVPNENYADNAASEGWDFLSNGIKLRADFSANTNIYIAFAESPFKYSNAR
jgi:hypothetical protein